LSSFPSPDSRRLVLAQGGRFALAGGAVAILYFAVTSVMRAAFGAPWPVAVAIGYAIATSVHFTLQRTVVFRSERGFELSIRAQLPRFAAIVVCQYLVTVAAMAVLPDALGLPSLLVYAGVAGAVTVTSFFILRTRLFHPSA
jgi:putative flippase GtrA